MKGRKRRGEEIGGRLRGVEGKERGREWKGDGRGDEGRKRGKGKETGPVKSVKPRTCKVVSLPLAESPSCHLNDCVKALNDTGARCCSKTTNSMFCLIIN